jgi:hypothetical protein
MCLPIRDDDDCFTSGANMNVAIRLAYHAALLAAAVTLLTACETSSHVLTGTVRPPISPDQVKIYTQPPPQFEEVARLNSSSGSSFAFGAQSKTDTVIERLKKEAAKLGANGVLLQGISDRPSGSIGVGFGTGSASPNSAVGAGVGTSSQTYEKEGVGLAIYVPPG